MIGPATLEYRGPPSAAGYMLPAMLRSPRSREAGGVSFPPLRLRWDGFDTPARDRAAIERLTGLGDEARLGLLAPHVTGFRALMALLTHRSFPLPIWRALQVRNHLVVHRPSEGAGRVLEAGVVGGRVLEKGVEVDVRTALRERGELVWESLSSFYYRGRFLGPGETPAVAERPPAVEGGALASWRMAGGGGLRLARLNGDYNPLHWSAAYARRRGFGGAFHHPQLAVGQSLARLPPPGTAAPLRLDFWVRGQVYAGADVELHASRQGGATVFALNLGGDARPALVGRLGPA